MVDKIKYPNNKRFAYIAHFAPEGTGFSFNYEGRSEDSNTASSDTPDVSGRNTASSDTPDVSGRKDVSARCLR